MDLSQLIVEALTREHAQTVHVESAVPAGDGGFWGFVDLHGEDGDFEDFFLRAHYTHPLGGRIGSTIGWDHSSFGSGDLRAGPTVSLIHGVTASLLIGDDSLVRVSFDRHLGAFWSFGGFADWHIDAETLIGEVQIRRAICAGVEILCETRHGQSGEDEVEALVGVRFSL